MIGGIWVIKGYEKQFEEEFHNHCMLHLGKLPTLMKWGLVPPLGNKYMGFYTGLVDFYFQYNQEGCLFFKTIVAPPTYDMDHPIYHDGDFEEGFYKLYYELLLHSLRFEHIYHIRIGKRSPSKKRKPLSENDRLYVLKDALNKGVKRKIYWMSIPEVVASVESRKAVDYRLMQLADIFMGAIGYQKNNLHEKANANKAKVFLANYICEKLGKRDLCFGTKWDDRIFNIFELRTK